MPPFATSWPVAYQLIVDVVPNGAPDGTTPSQPLPTVPAIVKLKAIAIAPDGTTVPPAVAVATDKVRVEPAASEPPESRLSYTRAGVIGWSAPAVAGPATLRKTPGVPVATQTHRLPA